LGELLISLSRRHAAHLARHAPSSPLLGCSAHHRTTSRIMVLTWSSRSNSAMQLTLLSSCSLYLPRGAAELGHSASAYLGLRVLFFRHAPRPVRCLLTLLRPVRCSAHSLLSRLFSPALTDDSSEDAIRRLTLCSSCRAPLSPSPRPWCLVVAYSLSFSSKRRWAASTLHFSSRCHASTASQPRRSPSHCLRCLITLAAQLIHLSRPALLARPHRLLTHRPPCLVLAPRLGMPLALVGISATLHSQVITSLSLSLSRILSLLHSLSLALTTCSSSCAVTSCSPRLVFSSLPLPSWSCRVVWPRHPFCSRRPGIECVCGLRR
jgi:hypothetical protein